MKPEVETGPVFPMAHPAVRQPWRDGTRPFEVVARVDHPDPAEAAGLAALDTAGGATGLALVLAGSHAARGFGLPATAEAVCRALDRIEPGAATLRVELPRDTDVPLLDELLAALDRQGWPHRTVDCALDPLGRDTAVRVRRLRDSGLGPTLVHADGRPHHDAGGTDVQELAAALASGVAGLRAVEAAGLPLGAEAVRFTLAADVDLFGTLAKFRALRRLWSRVLDACGLPARPVALHAETSWRMLARRDPQTNILRNAVASAAAILGGADGIAVLPFTSPLELPDASARRLARNTALVLIEEASLGRVADPAGGSGAVEARTDALCHEAWGAFRHIEAAGGLAALLASGAWQAELAESHDARRSAIDSGTRVVVGVTAFHPPGEAPAAGA